MKKKNDTVCTNVLPVKESKADLKYRDNKFYRDVQDNRPKKRKEWVLE